MTNEILVHFWNKCLKFYFCFIAEKKTCKGLFNFEIVIVKDQVFQYMQTIVNHKKDCDQFSLTHCGNAV